MTHIKKLYDDNKDKIHTVRQHIFTKDEVTTVIQTELVWESDVLRQVFEEVAVASLSGPTFDSKVNFKQKPKPPRDFKKDLCDVLKVVAYMTDEEKDQSNPIWSDSKLMRDFLRSKGLSPPEETHNG